MGTRHGAWLSGEEVRGVPHGGREGRGPALTGRWHPADSALAEVHTGKRCSDRGGRLLTPGPEEIVRERGLNGFKSVKSIQFHSNGFEFKTKLFRLCLLQTRPSRGRKI
jgi:hypothetical protein